MTVAEQDRLRSALAAERPMNWVLTGDSITHGLIHTQGDRSYAEHLHELIRGELGRSRDIIVNSAVTGQRITDILQDFDRRVISWQPNVVVLMSGTNDVSTGPGRTYVAPADFERSLREFVARVRSLDAVPVLQTPPSVDIAHAPERARIAEFVEAVRAVALDDDVLLVDHYARFLELGGGAPPWGLMNDPFHPNAAGHASMACELATALGIASSPGSRTLDVLQARVAQAAR